MSAQPEAPKKAMSLFDVSTKTGFTKSKIFEKRYIAFQHLFDAHDGSSVIACVDRTHHTRNTVAIHKLTDSFNEESVMANTFYHDNVTSLNGVLVDKDMKLYFTISDSPSDAYTLKNFVAKRLNKDITRIRQSVHSALKQTLILFMDLSDYGWGLDTLHDAGVLVNLDENGVDFKLTFMCNLLVNGATLELYKQRLVELAQMFSDVYKETNPYETRLTQPEYYFFQACEAGSTVSLRQLYDSPYIQSDPQMWNNDEVTWKVITDAWKLAEEVDESGVGSVHTAVEPEDEEAAEADDVVYAEVEDEDESYNEDDEEDYYITDSEEDYYEDEDDEEEDEDESEDEVEAEVEAEAEVEPEVEVEAEVEAEPKEEEVGCQFARLVRKHMNNLQQATESVKTSSTTVEAEFSEEEDNMSDVSSDESQEEDEADEVKSEYAFEYYEAQAEKAEAEKIRAELEKVEAEKIKAEIAMAQAEKAEEEKLKTKPQPAHVQLRQIQVNRFLENYDTVQADTELLKGIEKQMLKLKQQMKETIDEITMRSTLNVAQTPKDNDTVSVDTDVEEEEDDDAVSVHTAIEEDTAIEEEDVDDAASIHTAVEEEDDDAASVHTAVEEEVNTPNPDGFIDEYGLANEFMRNVVIPKDDPIDIVSVEDYVARVPLQPETEGTTPFGFYIRNLGMEGSYKCDKLYGQALEIVDAKCTYFVIKAISESAIALFYDGENLVGVGHQGCFYKHYNQLPTKVADWLSSARNLVNIVYDNRIMVNVSFKKLGATMFMNRDGMVTLRCDKYRQVYFSPKRMEETKVQFFKTDSVYGDMLKQFMMLPFNVNKYTSIEFA